MNAKDMNKLHAEALRINRKMDSLTTAARNAYNALSRARGRRALKGSRIQSTAEMNASAKYDLKERELSQFCRENGRKSVPQTWS